VLVHQLVSALWWVVAEVDTCGTVVGVPDDSTSSELLGSSGHARRLGVLSSDVAGLAARGAGGLRAVGGGGVRATSSAAGLVVDAVVAAPKLAGWAATAGKQVIVSARVQGARVGSLPLDRWSEFESPWGSGRWKLIGTSGGLVDVANLVIAPVVSFSADVDPADVLEIVVHIIEQSTGS
jgi:hypothetical protein